jgi:hypothetical protein
MILYEIAILFSSLCGVMCFGMENEEPTTPLYSMPEPNLGERAINWFKNKLYTFWYGGPGPSTTLGFLPLPEKEPKRPEIPTISNRVPQWYQQLKLQDMRDAFKRNAKDWYKKQEMQPAQKKKFNKEFREGGVYNIPGHGNIVEPW